MGSKEAIAGAARGAGSASAPRPIRLGAKALGTIALAPGLANPKNSARIGGAGARCGGPCPRGAPGRGPSAAAGECGGASRGSHARLSKPGGAVAGSRNEPESPSVEPSG